MPSITRRLAFGSALLVASLAACGGNERPTVAPATTPTTQSADDYAAQLDRLTAMENAGMTPEEIEAALERMDSGGSLPEAASAEVPTAAVFGDSSAMMTGLGLGDYGVAHPDVLISGGGWAELGCGLVGEGERRFRTVPEGILPACATWIEGWRAAAEEVAPDIAVVQFGPWEVVDTKLPGAADYSHIGQPEHDALLREQLAAGIDGLLGEEAFVVLLTSPTMEVHEKDGPAPATPFPESDPARVARWNELLNEVAAGYGPDEVAVVDLGGHIDALPPAEIAELMPDGVHFTWDTATTVADWLGPEIAAAWAEAQS